MASGLTEEANEEAPGDEEPEAVSSRRSRGISSVVKDNAEVVDVELPEEEWPPALV